MTWIYKLEEWIHRFLTRLFPICHGSEGPCFKLGKHRRRNTQYVDKEMNYVFQCDGCFKVEQELWQSMWDDYYRDKL